MNIVATHTSARQSSAPRLLRSAAAGFVCLLTTGPAERPAVAQEPAPAFSTEVQLITVDAVVLNSLGRPVRGLTQDDFAVFEDGHPQEIVRFEAFTEDPADEAPEPPTAVATNEGGERPGGRGYAIVVDDLGISPSGSDQARKAIASFLERTVRDGDDVTLGTTSGEAWWSTRIPEGRGDLSAVLGRVKGRYVASNSLDRMTDYEAFWINSQEDSPALATLRPDPPQGVAAAPSQAPDPTGGGIKERVKQRWKDLNLCTGTSCDGMVRGRAAEIDGSRKQRTVLTLEAMRRGIEALASVHGRKALLFFSQGFLDDPATDRRRVIAASREAHTAVYFVDLKGLEALPGGVGSAADPESLVSERDRTATAFQEAVLESAGSDALAEDTGGFSVRNTNDLAAGAERIAAETRVYYLLGFHPRPGKSARDWRKLKVEVKKPGLTVRARRGYVLGPAVEPAKAKGKQGKNPGPDAAVVRALDSPHDETGIPLRALTYVFEPLPKGATRVLVAAEFDAGRIPPPRKGQAAGDKLQLSIVATHRDSGVAFRFDEVLGLGGAETGAPNWREVAREIDMPAGVGQVRVVVRDPASGATGSVMQRFEAPPGDVFRLSTPVLTDHVEPAAVTGGRPRPAIPAHRLFKPAGALYVQFEVFGASKGEGGGSPRVNAGLALKTRDGRLVRDMPASPITVNPDGRLVRLIGMGLDGLAEGDYDLFLDVRDEVSGKHLQDHEPFTLARDLSAAARPKSPGSP
jgi:VWFA-related protein